MVVMCIFDGRMDFDDGIDERQLGGRQTLWLPEDCIVGF